MHFSSFSSALLLERWRLWWIQPVSQALKRLVTHFELFTITPFLRSSFYHLNQHYQAVPFYHPPPTHHYNRGMMTSVSIFLLAITLTQWTIHHHIAPFTINPSPPPNFPFLLPPPPALEWWDAVLQKRLAWALFVLLLSTLVCCQPTELIWASFFFFLFYIYSNLTVLLHLAFV